MPTKRKAIRKGERPVVCKDGHALLLMGLVADQVGCTCAHIMPATVERMGLKPGDYVQIDNSERCTQIVRQIATCGCRGMRHDYVYLDRDSVRYLEGEIHDCLRVRLAEYPLDCP